MLKNSWLFPLIQSVHLCGLALLVGTIAVVDLRLLGRAGRESVAEFARQLAPWTRAGFAVMLITGPIQFFSDTPRYTHNLAFRFKMGFLLLALITHFTLPRRGRVAAIISLTLWTCVVLGGRAIADFDI